MNINKKYIIIFGTLVLLLIIITGGITYYKEKTEQAQISDENKYQSQILGERHSILSFSQPNPADTKEFLGFIDFCKNARLSDIHELKDSGIKEVACMIVKVLPAYIDLYTSSDKPYIPLIFPLKSIISFEDGRYVGISVDIKDVVREYDVSFLEQDKLYFCSISEPSWADSFYLQMEPKQNLIFDEGDVSCGGIRMDQTPSINFSGFVPLAESLKIQEYLVDEQTVSDVMNRQSFSEIKEILNDYPIIWQMEKLINL